MNKKKLEELELRVQKLTGVNWDKCPETCNFNFSDCPYKNLSVNGFCPRPIILSPLLMEYSE
jgi:hypothetical protein